ncbi:TetR/AcrR family transcriptional regulator [Lentzea sp. CA-135723]|uniref:TetR/AcrR family transcriptional regulator n=1 Tax=Lentzea sp. CA-135723 TaxID=3239950 RepID=UPI003D8FB339
MPKISEERRVANRAAIVAAAARCFARNGFHQTSMPDIAAEAGLSAGAPYRYFAGKEDLIAEVAALAFGVLFQPVNDLIDQKANPTLADLVAAATGPTAGGAFEEDLLRCAVQSWAELLRNPGLRERAVHGVAGNLDRIGAALGRTLPDTGVAPATGARIVVALLHGFLLQRVAFGLADPVAAQDVLAAFGQHS